MNIPWWQLMWIRFINYDNIKEIKNDWVCGDIIVYLKNGGMKYYEHMGSPYRNNLRKDNF